jgi:hypothetical protein
LPFSPTTWKLNLELLLLKNNFSEMRLSLLPAL